MAREMSIGNRVGPPRFLLFLALLAGGYWAARTIPMGTAYAVWGGIGAVGTVMVGMAFFGEPTTTLRLLLILGIVGCIAALKLTA